MRDPRDVVVSRHGKKLEDYWAELDLWKEMLVHYRRVASHPRFITIRYEDLVSDPGSVQAKLHQLMPFLNKTADFSSYHTLAKPSAGSLLAMRDVREIDTSSISNWKNHLPRIAGQIELYGSISDILIEFGYEEDRQWEALLKGVEPDISKRSKPNPPTWKIKRRHRFDRGYTAATMSFFCDRFGVPLI